MFTYFLQQYKYLFKYYHTHYDNKYVNTIIKYVIPFYELLEIFKQLLLHLHAIITPVSTYIKQTTHSCLA